MRTQGKRISFANLQHTVLRQRTCAEKLLDHGKCFRISHELHLRVPLRQMHEAAGMIRLHVCDYKIVGAAPLQHLRHIGKPFLRRPCVHAVHHSDLLIQNDIGVVAHPHRLDRVLVFKECQCVVVRPYIADRIRYRSDGHRKNTS